jgi:hypothetical protein
MHHHIVRAIQAAAEIAIREQRLATIQLGAGDAAEPVRTADEPTLTVSRMAIGEMGGFAKNRDPALLAPADDTIIGDVADQQLVRVSAPDRAFEPREPLAQT